MKGFKRGLVILLIVLVILIMWIPFIWMISVSFRSPAETFVPAILPPNPTLRTYSYILTNARFLTYFRNSFVVAFFSSVIALIFSVSAGYGLSRFKFRGHTFITVFMLLNRLFPRVMMVISLFLMIIALGLYDNLLSLIIVNSAYTLPFAVYILRSFFDGISRDIEEAAMLDGCSRMGSILRVILPLSASGMAATVFYCFLLAWNEYLYALTFTSSLSSRMITVGMAETMHEYVTLYPVLMGLATLTGFPPVIFFLMLQKYLIRGFTAVSIK